MNVMCFLLANQDRSFAIELKNDGQRALSDQELDGPSWRAEMKVQHHMYAVFKLVPINPV